MAKAPLTSITNSQRLMIAFIHAVNPENDAHIRQFMYNACPRHHWGTFAAIDRLIKSLLDRQLIKKPVESGFSPYIVTPEGHEYLKCLDYSKFNWSDPPAA